MLGASCSELASEEAGRALKMDRHVQIEDIPFCSLGSSADTCYQMRVNSSVEIPL